MSGLDKRSLLQRLPEIPRDDTIGEDEVDLQQLSLGSALLMLAEVNHEHEYELCREVARHCLGEAHEPEDLEVDEAPGR